MAQRSKIAKLPKNLREKVERFLAQEDRSVDEFVSFVNTLLDGMGRKERVSRSGAHRYMQGFDRVVEDLRKSRALAEVLVAPLSEAGEERVGRLNVELLHSLIMKLMLGPGDAGEPVKLDAKEAMAIGIALEKLSKAQALDAARTLKLRKEFAVQAADAAAEVAKEKGFSAETVAAIRHAVLGIVA